MEIDLTGSHEMMTSVKKDSSVGCDIKLTDQAAARYGAAAEKEQLRISAHDSRDQGDEGDQVREVEGNPEGGCRTGEVKASLQERFLPHESDNNHHKLSEIDLHSAGE
ncbi:hypothetical protein CERZMDRAFT_102771 [Cercospora zeae-maydis SCOH1-5]|uniref:Uncharacterized protein n=1 Tax=Cercospora zeae-maydis SCOH1-5 TaxID=717836 RepID=A0A6A6F0X1_9PEZI|nr:hypothetical protein CERZMDRAFT_102771 [Cercospora zeae-maydis SCOH1-5]